MKKKPDYYASWTRYVPIPILLVTAITSLPIFLTMGMLAGCQVSLGEWAREVKGVWDELGVTKAKQWDEDQE